jgi:hypothetical protein
VDYEQQMNNDEQDELIIPGSSNVLGQVPPVRPLAEPKRAHRALLVVVTSSCASIRTVSTLVRDATADERAWRDAVKNCAKKL